MADAFRLLERYDACRDAPYWRPSRDAAIEAIFEGVQLNAAQSFMTHLMTNPEALPSSLPTSLRDFLDRSTAEALPDSQGIESAQGLFVVHGPEILMTLGCYALPDAFAARKGVKVLHQDCLPRKNVRIDAYSEPCGWLSM